MKLGYACINMSLGNEGKFKTITVKSASKMTHEELIKKIKGIAIDNLYTTYKILQWNLEHNIYMYRLTSNVIPLATHELLKNWQWWIDKDILNICNRIKQFINDNNIRISMHPNQFCILNSNKDEVINMALGILNYHNKLSNLLGNDTLILHVGGVYGDKDLAKSRFINNFSELPKEIQKKIVLENDDKSYNIEDVLYICNKCNIPMCIDFHHARCLVSDSPIETYIEDIIDTWGSSRTPKCHISSGRDCFTDIKHADYIINEDFEKVLNYTKGKFDIMFECKMKEVGLLSIINE